MERIKVVQYGIGPIGLMVTKIIAGRSSLEIIGAIDCDPGKCGRELGDVAGVTGIGGIRITDCFEELVAKTRPDVVVLTTTSSLHKIRSQILEILDYGVNVVTTCEELSYPWITNPDIASEIDNKARERNASVLSTGINPGFVMDLLPIVISGVCQDIRTITIERIQDAQYRRAPFQTKIGAGLLVEQFKRKVEEGIIRHVGLTESIHMIAHRFGWIPEKTTESIEPVVAKHDMVVNGKKIPAGNVLGVEQIGRCYIDGQERITLVFRAAVGEGGPRDRIIINGTPAIELTIKEGIAGDAGTCAMVVNAIPVVVSSTPGLRTMADVKPVSFFAN